MIPFTNVEICKKARANAFARELAGIWLFGTSHPIHFERDRHVE